MAHRQRPKVYVGPDRRHPAVAARGSWRLDTNATFTLSADIAIVAVMRNHRSGDDGRTGDCV